MEYQVELFGQNLDNIGPVLEILDFRFVLGLNIFHLYSFLLLICEFDMTFLFFSDFLGL